jgi:two-component system phosphate regulon sensor histidine kinase PhoR
MTLGAVGPALPVVVSILEALEEPTLLLSGQGRIRLANGAAKERLGVWVIGQSYISVLRQPALLAPVETALFDGRAGTARFNHSSGELELPYDVTVTPLSREADGTWAVLLVFRDLSERSTSESMRRDFVANVSHELKTPLTAVIGFVETLQGPARDDPAGRDRFLGLMAQELARMNRLVSDLLSLSRVEGQSRQRPRETVDLVAVLAEAIDALRPGAEADRVDVVLDAPDVATAPGDAGQLGQVAMNLIENAVKYGARPGRVTVTVDEMDRDPVIKGPAWRIRVADQGEGIAPEHIPRLTERFYRVDTGRSRHQGGTGLGLAIVKHIVNRHRGRLKISSRIDVGTEIAVLLPRIVGARPPASS